MGFFDKAKHFMGGHGVKVNITRIERQPADAAQMPITDTVIKGNFGVTSEKACTVLSHEFEFLAVYKDNQDLEQESVLGHDKHDESTDIIGGDIKWPYEMAAGQTVTDAFNIIMDSDIPTELRKVGFSDPSEAVRSGKVTFKIRVKADVKGSPFDPKGEATLRITT